MGLDNVFSTIKTQILASKPNPTLGTAYHLISEDEQQRAISATKKPTQEVVAFQSSGNRREWGSDLTSQRNKGMAKDAKRNSSDEVEHCTFCGRSGHNKEGCFKRIGYPKWWPGKGKKDNVKSKAAVANLKTSQVPILFDEQYQGLLKYFAKESSINTKPSVNMAGRKTIMVLGL